MATSDDLRASIIQTAQQLGINPADLATAISYETAGTFDPWKAGPTTQWGQHRGLIQWGEPQAKQYGVSESTPVAQQMQAVGQYLQDRGVQPGMGLLDIYSAINAGSVGKYNASDANNGGAPGTVRDKVEGQMSGHREKALALLGGDFQTPTPVAVPVEATPTLASASPPAGILALLGADPAPAAEPSGFEQILASIQRPAAPQATEDDLSMDLDALTARRLAWARQNGWSA